MAWIAIRCEAAWPGICFFLTVNDVTRHRRQGRAGGIAARSEIEMRDRRRIDCIDTLLVWPVVIFLLLATCAS